MITEKMARVIALKNLPGWTISKVIDYKGLYIFLMIDDGPEGGFDPFYSVNKKTGKFEGFSYIRDQDEMFEIDALFDQAND